MYEQKHHPTEPPPPPVIFFVFFVFSAIAPQAYENNTPKEKKTPHRFCCWRKEQAKQYRE
jgi:hypothetical protein